ncbi:hypothetical protein IDJ77_10590 [Mucilaginibacter sp. ZT4R22]|uniref:Trehalase n=1 Tax=Mucilaginibacter pankratovii TaxID=2772110 RepID=A0ABR7WPM4_9SPHI|nr:hypothetical protein [Mucilaginibacter pankratovii]MBD1364255.1 hypothetical protein [Mucilaginibacter pankratovii]
MKKSILLFVVACFYNYASAQNTGLSFTSDDAALQTAFNNAKAMALSYKGKPADPVGPWYESALPPRFAFCMRDVSHQALAGQVLGLQDANKNMLTLFAKNISQSKDWCTYWEINHFGKPAPEDYRNDKEFWYNLDANFDVMTTCWKLYLWTGDKEYIQGKAFKNFYHRSAKEFISKWVLQPDSLLTRPAHPNAPVPFNVEDSFHRCRGLPSYSEGVPDIKMGADLLAAIYRGLLSYAEILKVNGQQREAAIYAKKAEAYQKQLDKQWWDDKASLYFTYYSNKNVFGKTEGETFLLWFDALKDSARRKKTLEHLLANDWNIENLSYFPYLMYENGYPAAAYKYILHLTNPATERREYPEVSFGVIKGFTEGLMGIAADARYNSISTLYRNNNDVGSALYRVPVLNTLINIRHVNKKKSVLTNKGNKMVNWRASFYGNHALIYINAIAHKAIYKKDGTGNAVSYASVKVNAGDVITAYVK